MAMRAALLAGILVIAGCRDPKTFEQVHDGVIKQMASRVRRVDLSKPPPDIPLPKNPPKEVDKNKVAVESAKITKLRTEDIVLGSGPMVQVGKAATVHYVGLLPDGYVFDTSYKDRAQPFTFMFDPHTTGVRVVDGWYKGIAGMRVGGRRKVYIPASMAYGANPPAGSPIPPNSALIFDIELMFVGGAVQ